MEQADVVIVGGRCAGSGTAIPLSRAGRDVVVLDGAAFPSDTLSTHLLFPAGVAEIERLGALDPVRELGAPELPVGMLWGLGVTVSGRFTPVDGNGHGWCVRRTGLDHALVETARAAGADVRERTRVTELLREGKRVTGVRYRTRDGELGEIRARLVVGADGRRSSVASMVGARRWANCPNGRMMVYAYATDPHRQWRETAAQWRVDRELGTVFPCDGEHEGEPLMLVLLMPPAERAPEFRDDAEAAWERTVAVLGPMADRLAGSVRVTKLHVSREHPSFFRRSTGPGWALTGDAGHFKDPVTAQGIRDALRFGRLLGEAVAPALDDDVRLTAAMRAWERRRDRECFDMYQWSNLLGRGDSVSPVELEAYRTLADSPREILDVFSRVREPSEVFTARRGAVWTGRALRRSTGRRAAVLRVALRDAGRALTAAGQRRLSTRAF